LEVFTISSLVDFLLPDCPGLQLVHLVVLDQQVLLLLKTTNPIGLCPYCQTPSERVHCYYNRTLADLAWADWQVKLQIKVRRFVCLNATCSHTTFAERLGCEIKAYARRTKRCEERLRQLALALGAEAGARLAREFGLPISPDTLLRLTRATPLTSKPTPRVLGVDDFALRKGAKYGTILLDLERGWVVELLADRETKTFASWLQAHPGIEIISRDRASGYAEAARVAAPQAIQVADRFHLHQNLTQTLERIMRRYYPSLAKLVTAPLTLPQTKIGAQITTPGEVPTEMAAGSVDMPLKRWEAEKELSQQRRMIVYEQATTLYEQGYNQTEIAKRLSISPRRVGQYLKGPPTPPVYKPRPTKLDPYKPYLKRRFYEEGCHNSLQLLREINEQGYHGSSSVLTNYVTQLRAQGGVELATGKTRTQAKPLREGLATPRQLAWWFVLPRKRLSANQRQKLAHLRGSEAKLGEIYQLSQAFVALLHSGSDRGLTRWLAAVERSGVSELLSFGKGLRRDEAAVRAGLRLSFSQGLTEGKINRLKLIKRQGYGRASFDLLRIKVLAVA
jgi:transposase